jgi:hypothetical protein
VAYTAKTDGAWIDRSAPDGTATTNLIDAGDCNRWESNQFDAHTRLTALETPTASVKTASYTLVLADIGKVIEFNSASATTLTVPLNASVAFPIGTLIEVFQVGTGSVTIGGSATLRSPAGLILRAQYSTVALRKRGTDEWVVSGDV